MNSNKTYSVKKSVLNGTVKIDGAKNSALKLLSASILTDKKVMIENYPNSLLDIKLHEEMLVKLGKDIEKPEDSSIIISGNINNNTLGWDKRSIRNSLLILGCLLTKTGYGKVPLPGGCKLGERKYDIHIDLMQKMGADVWEEGDYLCAKITQGGKLNAVEYNLPIRSTGATENGILMSVLAKGISRIWNPHVRPEVLDLIEFLNKMGAKIKVNGQESIIIEGVQELNSEVKHSTIPDNMEALTFLIAGAICGDTIEIKNFPLKHLEVPLIFLRESGLKYYTNVDTVIVKKSDIYPIDISTGPYPGINSDMQPLFAVYGLMSKGISKITDLRFVGRYKYADELTKMGGIFKETNNVLKVIGGNPLVGCTVQAVDLRAGAALVIAGLAAEGETIIENAWQVLRGYNNLEAKLKSIGARFNLITTK